MASSPSDSCPAAEWTGRRCRVEAALFCLSISPETIPPSREHEAKIHSYIDGPLFATSRIMDCTLQGSATVTKGDVRRRYRPFPHPSWVKL